MKVPYFDVFLIQDFFAFSFFSFGGDVLRNLLYNQGSLKILGYGEHRKILLTISRCIHPPDDSFLKSTLGALNDSKLENNIFRAKQAIFELAYCNPWDYFFTGTLDSKKYDRTDLDTFHHDLGRWICYINRHYSTSIKYLFIPELHADLEAWHLHGFLRGIPDDMLHQFVIGDRMGFRLAGKVAAGEQIFNWPAYAGKFGFCDLEPIRNSEAISKYCTKYISKDLFRSVKELGAHLYYHSRGLKRAEVIAKGPIVGAMEPLAPTFENDYCVKYEFDFDSALLSDLGLLFDDDFANLV